MPAIPSPQTKNTLDVSSVMVAALEHTWVEITARHPEIPPVVIVLASGSDRKGLKYGHHAAKRWKVHDRDRTEILISGEGLRRPPREVLGTLLHEAAHALATARNIKDTSRQGRYHNKKYAALAEELGITVAHDDRIGWSVTTVPDETAEQYADQILVLTEAMILWRHNEPTAPTSRSKSSNLIAAVCPCERTIRIAETSLDEAPVICGACDQPFTPKD